MKKILLIICSILASIDVTYALSIKEEDIYSNTKEDGSIITIKKIFDENENVYFNLDMTYSFSDDFVYLTQFDENVCYGTKDDLAKFETIVYFGYLVNPTDQNYLITQLLIWSNISGLESDVEYILSTLDNSYRVLYNNILFNVIYHLDDMILISYLWDTVNLKFQNIEVSNNEGLVITPNGEYSRLFFQEVGNYELTINYPEEDVNFLIATSQYWQSLGGPYNGYKKIYFEVLDSTLKINETLVGVDGYFGDAVNNSIYELYLNDKLMATTIDYSFRLGGSKYYTLKSNSSEGFQDVFVTFKAKAYDYEINIEKKVISKKYQVSINDDNVYQIYLKSTNELYKEISKDTLEVILPYGVYEIRCANVVVMTVSVLDEVEDELIINKEGKKEEEPSLKEDIVSEEDITSFENMGVYLKEDESSGVYEDMPVSNPKTGQTGIIFIIVFGNICVLLMLLYIYHKIELCKEM